jgi:hypothetical protein
MSKTSSRMAFLDAVEDGSSRRPVSRNRTDEEIAVAGSGGKTLLATSD